MFPVGDDNSFLATAQYFDGLDEVVELLRSRYGVNAVYSTPSRYLDAALEEKEIGVGSGIEGGSGSYQDTMQAIKKRGSVKFGGAFKGIEWPIEVVSFEAWDSDEVEDESKKNQAYTYIRVRDARIPTKQKDGVSTLDFEWVLKPKRVKEMKEVRLDYSKKEDRGESQGASGATEKVKGDGGTFVKLHPGEIKAYQLKF